MKLLLADDHALFRDSLVQYLVRAEPATQIHVAEDFPGVLEILKQSPDQDLVLLDLRMPGMHGLKGFETLREKFPDLKVALMSGIAEPEDVRRALAMGAAGYFPKTLSGKALLRGIQEVLAGEQYIPVDADSNLMPSYFDDRGEPAQKLNPVHLTPREKQVLRFLSEGASNKEIANALGLQVVTVKLHVRGVCKKLEAKNRTQAAIRAREMGLAS